MKKTNAAQIKQLGKSNYIQLVFNYSFIYGVHKPITIHNFLYIFKFIHRTFFNFLNKCVDNLLRNKGGCIKYSHMSIYLIIYVYIHKDMHKIMKFKFNIFSALIFHKSLCIYVCICFVPIKQLVNDENAYMLIIIFHMPFQINETTLSL